MQPGQLIPGAVNVNSSSPFCHGFFDGHSFLAYGCREHVIVLSAPSLSLVQVLDGNDKEVTAISWCRRGGRLAAASSGVVVVYAPDTHVGAEHKTRFYEQIATSCRYRWSPSVVLRPESIVLALSWAPSGDFLLCGGSMITLWPFKMEHGVAVCDAYQPMWSEQPAVTVYHAQISADGRLFVTAGQFDRLPKVWFRSPSDPLQNLQMSLLPHPRAVQQLQWRHLSGSQRTDSFVPNVLMTWAVDSVIRLWLESSRSEDISFHVVCEIAIDRIGAQSMVCWLDTGSYGIQGDEMALQPLTETQEEGDHAVETSKIHFHHGHSVTSAEEQYAEQLGLSDRAGPYVDWLVCVQGDYTVSIYSIRGLVDSPRRSPEYALYKRLKGAFENVNKALLPSSSLHVFADPFMNPPKLSMFALAPGRAISNWILPIGESTDTEIHETAVLAAFFGGHLGDLDSLIMHESLPLMASLDHRGSIRIWKTDQGVLAESTLLQTLYPLGPVDNSNSHRYTSIAWGCPSICLFAASADGTVDIFAPNGAVSSLDVECDLSGQTGIFRSMSSSKLIGDILSNENAESHTDLPPPEAVSFATDAPPYNGSGSDHFADQDPMKFPSSISAHPQAVISILSANIPWKCIGSIPAVSSPHFIRQLTVSPVIPGCCTFESSSGPEWIVTALLDDCQTIRIWRVYTTHDENHHTSHHHRHIKADLLSHFESEPGSEFTQVFVMINDESTSSDELQVELVTVRQRSIDRFGLRKRDDTSSIWTLQPLQTIELPLSLQGFICGAHMSTNPDGLLAVVTDLKQLAIYTYTKFVALSFSFSSVIPSMDKPVLPPVASPTSSLPLQPRLCFAPVGNGRHILAVLNGSQVEFLIQNVRTAIERDDKVYWKYINYSATQVSCVSTSVSPKTVDPTAYQYSTAVASTNAHFLPVTTCGRCLTWTHDGHLVVGTAQEILAFSPQFSSEQIQSKPVSPVRSTSPSQVESVWLPASTALVDSMHEHDMQENNLFRMVFANQAPVPVYHPTSLRECVRKGKYGRVKTVLRRLAKLLEENLQITSTLSLSLKDLCEKDESAVTVPATVQADNKGTSTSSTSGQLDWFFEPKPSVTATTSSSFFDEPAPAPAKKVDTGPTFSEAEAAALNEILGTTSVPGLDSVDNMQLMALIDTFAKLQEQQRSLDECGTNYLLSVKLFKMLSRTLPVGQRPKSLTTADVSFALHCNSKETLIQLCLDKDMDWPTLSAYGYGFWVESIEEVKKRAADIANNAFKATKDPNTAAIWYGALKRKNILLQLYKISRAPIHTKMYELLSNDFTTDRWKSAAQKNAFVLRQKQNYELAAFFFMLGGQLDDAVKICVNDMGDVQLALLICRLSEGDNGPEYKKTLEQYILPVAKASGDMWLESICHWLLKKHAEALQALSTSSQVDSDRSRTPDSPSPHSAGGVSPNGSPSTVVTHNGRRVIHDPTRCKCSPLHAFFHPAVSSLAKHMSTSLPVKRSLPSNASAELIRTVSKRSAVAFGNSGLPLLALEELYSAGINVDSDESVHVLYETFAIGVLSSYLIDGMTQKAVEDGFTTLIENMDYVCDRFDIPRHRLLFYLRKYLHHAGLVRIESSLLAGLRQIPDAFSVLTETVAKVFEVVSAVASESLRLPVSERTLTVACQLSDCLSTLSKLWRESQPARASVTPSSGSEYPTSPSVASRKFSFGDVGPSSLNTSLNSTTSVSLVSYNQEKTQVNLHSPTTSRSPFSASLVMALSSGGSTSDQTVDIMRVEVLLGIYMSLFLVAYTRSDWTALKTILEDLLQFKRSYTPYSWTPSLALVGVFNRLVGSVHGSTQASSQSDESRSRAGSDAGSHAGSDVPARSASSSKSALSGSPKNRPSEPPVPSTDPMKKESDEETQTFLTQVLRLLLVKRLLANINQIVLGLNKLVAGAPISAPPSRKVSISYPDPPPERQPVTITSVPPAGKVLSPVPKRASPLLNGLANALHLNRNVSAPSPSNGNANSQTVGNRSATPATGSGLGSSAGSTHATALPARPSSLPSLSNLARDTSTDNRCFPHCSLSLQKLEESLKRWVSRHEKYVEQTVKTKNGQKRLLSLFMAMQNVKQEPAESGRRPLQPSLFSVRDDREKLWINTDGSLYLRSLFVQEGVWCTPDDLHAVTLSSGSYMAASKGKDGDNRFISPSKTPPPNAESQEGVEIYKKHGDLVRSICLNRVDPRYISAATAKGIREVNLEHCLRFRKRSPDGRILLDEENQSWEACLHRFDTEAFAFDDRTPLRPSAYDVTSFSSMSTGLFRKRKPVSIFAQPYDVRIMEDNRDRKLSDFLQLRPKKRLDHNDVAFPLQSHPLLPVYLSGAPDGNLTLWCFGHVYALSQYTGCSARITAIRFNSMGDKFAATEVDGHISLYRFDTREESTVAHHKFPCHSKRASSMAFLNAGSVVATVGISHGNQNLRVWDTLQPPARSLIDSRACHDGGAHSVIYSPQNQVLYTGGKKGELCVYDLRQRKILATLPAHNSSLKCLVMNKDGTQLITGCNGGDIKVWNTSDMKIVKTFKHIHGKHTFVTYPTTGTPMSSYGVTDLTLNDNALYSCGGDGTIKLLRI